MMETSTSSGGGGLRVGKLIPKSISSKRRRRKEKEARDSEASSDARSTSPSSSRKLSKQDSILESDSANSTNLADDEELDDESFASYELAGGAPRNSSTRPASTSAPARPSAPSSHPSLIGYLTTSSPVVQAAHLDSQSQIRPPPSLTSANSSRSPSPTKSINGKRATISHPAIPEPPAAAKIASADRRARAPPKIETQPPRTPPKDDKPAPAIVNTPPTPTERRNSAVGASPERKTPRSGGSPRASADGSPTSLIMNVHRRSKSGSAALVPSKLSNITAAPLTPTDEGGDNTPGATGFFSSIVSAAQNAANSFSNTIPTSGLGIVGNKSRSSLAKSQHSASQSQTELEPQLEPEPRIEDKMDRKESAVRTLGAGELSLSQLGLADTPGTVVTPVGARLPDIVDTRARSESAPPDSHAHDADLAPEESLSRPRSIAEPTSGEQTPPQMEYADIKGGAVQRSSSLRSAMKPHRKRGSSVTTGNTASAVAAAVAAANNSAVAPTGGLGAPKLTGFAIASKKRNRDFHSFFKSVPDDDYLIEDYSCALQREILAHGRLYVSEGHLCFSSNILGWTTTLVMSFDEIVSVEKRSTALVFKNGLMISTLHAKHVFASFTSRDATYDLIVNIWKLGHPTLRSTLNGVQLEGTGGDKTEKVDAEPETVEEEQQEEASGSEDDSSEADEDEFYDEEEHDELLETQSTDMTAVEAIPEKPVSRKVSTMTTINKSDAQSPKEPSPSPTGAADFPGPAMHPPTDCGDSASHYDKILADDVIPAPLGKVYDLVFGPGSVNWMGKWLASDQKCTDIQMEDKSGLTADNRSRTFTYIKPLNGSIGPKQTKCVVNETIENIDLEKAVNLSVSTQTPDVPYGGVFTTKTKYCLSWAENNATRVQINCTVEWTGKSFLKGTIERSVNEGQGQYCKELFASLKSAVSGRGRSGTGPGGPGRGKKKLKKSKTLQSAGESDTSKMDQKNKSKTNWGPLSPVVAIVEPIFDVLQPVLTGNVMYGLLVGLVVAMWFGFGTNSGRSNNSFGPEVGYYNPSRLAAYEEMWRREDSELWEWLEERVGMDRLNSNQPPVKKRGMEPRTVEERLREEKMEESEVQEAIRVTEEKLRVLRDVVGKAAIN